MPEPRRREYVISVPTGFQAASARFRQSLREVPHSIEGRIIASLGDDGEKLASMTDSEVQKLKTVMPGVVIERNIAYKKCRHPLLERFQSVNLAASGSNKTVTIRVTDATTQGPLSNVTVYLISELASMSGFSGKTDAVGECQFIIPLDLNRAEMIACVPTRDYWSRRIKDVSLNGTQTVPLAPLPPSEPEVYDWGHRYSAMIDGAGNGGAAVKIGVVDTGIRNDHRDLAPTGGLNCVYDEDESRWHQDDDGHGSHCAGVIAALMNDFGIKGYVPAARLLSYRVFGKSGTAMTYDLVKALKRAVQDECDIISMSLSSDEPQIAVRIQTESAYDKGILCVAATGNGGGERPNYPAAFPLVVGVGAFGRSGTYPQDSLHSDAESAIRADEGCFLANFSNFGDQIVDFCAPGVAIRSTVPGGYAAMDGTSMACPHVTGIAALALASHPDVLNLPRDADRVERLLRLLRGVAKPLGFGPKYEGAGFLEIGRILSAQ
jgi:subtilisin